MLTNNEPDLQDIENIVREYLGEGIKSAVRFPTGLCHFVYDLKTLSGHGYAIRIASSQDSLEQLHGNVYWYDQMVKLGIPVPHMFHHNLAGQFPFVLIERFPGTDLGNVYSDLTLSQKKNIVHEIVSIQEKVSALPEASGFGYALSYDDPNLKRHPGWADVIESSLTRARKWIGDVGVCDPRHVDRVARAARRNGALFKQVKPTAFLDDTTTKNVIINNGRLSGIVDLDEICFGDRLYTVALTNMALLARKERTDYIDLWCERLSLDQNSRTLLALYTAIHCLTFMGEIGQKFNKEEADVDRDKIEHFERVLDGLLQALWP